MTSDHVHAWYEGGSSADSGTVKQSLGYALSRNSVWVQQCNSAVIEDHMVALCSSIARTRTHELSPAVRTQTQYSCLASEPMPMIYSPYFSNDNGSTSMLRTNSYSLSSVDKGIELADDLIKSYECFMRSVAPSEANPSRRANERPVHTAISTNSSHSSRTSTERTTTPTATSSNKGAPQDIMHMYHGPKAPLGKQTPADAIPKDAMRNPSVESSIPLQTGSILQNRFQTAKEQFTNGGGRFKENAAAEAVGAKRPAATTSSSNGTLIDKESKLPEQLQNYDPELVLKISSEIVHHGQQVTFADISGLDFAKKCVTELICWPMSRPDLFKGLRSLPRGVLLFGPPGTGKTLIGKAIAHQSGATFFSISASSLMSKWIGEGEKTVRTLFAVAAYRQPSVVFLDEVDSLLCQRSSEENEASRRMKTEFMVQLDGAGTDQGARVVIVGATNRPEELDEAVRRRFIKRIYIPLPDAASRESLLRMLLRDVRHHLSEEDCMDLVARTEGFSGADIRSLCTEAAMGPVREVALQSSGDLSRINIDAMPPISVEHFSDAFEGVVTSVSPNDLHRYIEWNNLYGSFRRVS